MYRPVILTILDGWGINATSPNDILKTTPLPTIEKIKKFYPYTTLQASGISVGLPWGESGNSEVGHLVLGAGKIIYQNLPRISLSIQDHSFFKNPVLLDAFDEAIKKKSNVHLFGLVSNGAVHSHMEHLYALLEMAKNQGAPNVYIHAFTDGRDSSPTSGRKLLATLQERLASLGVGKLATVCGRNWAMDRNNNWDRVEKAYLMLTEGKGAQVENLDDYISKSYNQKITDEYLEPAVILENGKPMTTVKDTDSVIFFNFREDRARELTKAFTVSDFSGFKREKLLQLDFITFTEYENGLPVKIAFPKELVKNGLGEVLSKNKKTQLRIAETEKYAHVTYFFNGGEENPWPGEDRILVPSPSVSRFDETPEMSAAQITEKAMAAINSQKYDFILINYANADMVGHTGNEQACIEAVKSIDKTLSLLIPATLKAGGCLLITADHGNVEELNNFQSGQHNTEHSTNPVPCWLIAPDNHREKTNEEVHKEETEIGGLISDIAPTVLAIMEVEKPADMSGESLLTILK
jgi:2,3-bisphosphoglycerate-independent phosphoglycerate mutase